MTNAPEFGSVNAHNEDLSFRLSSLGHDNCLQQFQRLNCYTVILMTEGEAKLFADHAEYKVKANSMMFFSPYQAFKLNGRRIEGYILNFHSDFLCVYKHHKEVACNGVLFENVYGSPKMFIEKKDTDEFLSLIAQIKAELQKARLAQNELLVSYLKIFLITATRLKIGSNRTDESSVGPAIPVVLQQLKEAIEAHYRNKHSPSEYAELLCISGKTLAKLTRGHLNKTPTDLIVERIMVEAKRDLYLTNKTIKEIAFNLGYDDEFYFSRLFKATMDVSPQNYRKTVGFGKGVIQNDVTG